MWRTLTNFNDLIERARSIDPDLAKDLEAEVRDLNKQRTFGLVFERHLPESVNLPGLKVRRGSKVRMLPSRGATTKVDERVWTVSDLGGETASLVLRGPNKQVETSKWPVEDLVAVAEFNDVIYPGLVLDGEVNDKASEDPAHVVINAENYHALEMLTYTHRRSIDAIYIDPPYNTGAKDWKYNNDYVDGNDGYRHSKWLSFMERRLKIAKELLNPDDSVLIVTIDEKEYHRLAMLLEQVFPEARIQMVTSVINPKGNARRGEFSRVEEYIFVVKMGDSFIGSWHTNMLDGGSTRLSDSKPKPVRWKGLLRSADNGRRVARPNLFYPIFLESKTGRFHSAGEPLPLGKTPTSVEVPAECVAVWPLGEGGRELTWSLQRSTLVEYRKKGYVRFGPFDGESRTPYYLTSGQIRSIETDDGTLVVAGQDEDGALILESPYMVTNKQPMTVWNQVSHSATEHGTGLIKAVLGDKRFTYPKSLYAVEDALRFFVKDKPEATILDFFSGSGTTAHAVMRLNKQDGGKRRSISVTNNEVSADEQKALTVKGLRPGDEEWEALGIANYVTKPRVKAAITGKTPTGDDIKGDYKFTDEFPMKDGFKANAKFFTLTYEDPLAIQLSRAFKRIAPLLWLRAGQQGPIIDDLSKHGYGVSAHYGVIESLDYLDNFITKVEDSKPGLVFIITDDRRQFQHVAGLLPSGIETVRLYESYLSNFEVNTGRYA